MPKPAKPANGNRRGNNARIRIAPFQYNQKYVECDGNLFSNKRIHHSPNTKLLKFMCGSNY
jgi:hypothetical protein